MADKQMMMNVAEIRKIKQHGITVLQTAQAMKVTSQATFDKAAEFLKDIKAAQDIPNAKLGPIIKSQYDALKQQRALLKEMLEIPNEAETVLKAKMSAYAAERRRIVEELNRKREEEARKKAEAKRQRQIAEAEKERRAAEAKHAREMAVIEKARKAEEAEHAEKLAVAKKKHDREEARRLDQEREAEKRRLAAEEQRAEKAREVARKRAEKEAKALKEKEVVVKFDKKRHVDKHDGVATRQAWSARVVDGKKFLIWVLADWNERCHFVVPHEVNLNKEAREHKAELKNLIPGVEGVAEEVVGAESRG